MPKVKKDPKYNTCTEYDTNVIDTEIKHGLPRGERALLFAILNRCYLDLAESSQLTERSDKWQAYRWVISKEEHEFSFIWICELLDLDMGIVKKKFLEKLKETSN